MQFKDGGYRQFLQRPFFLSPSGELRHATGGEFAALGVVEREILKFYGLRATDRLVDVGCCAGRLVAALRDWFTGSYLGTDVVRSLLAASRDLAPSGTWKFVKVNGIHIPAADDSADLICMFSVLTHLLYEDSYNYLSEAQRVLRVGGRIVFSFLEFREANHWNVFMASIATAKAHKKLTLNMFISRDAIEAWASHLNLRIVDVRGAYDRFVPLPEPVVLDSGGVMQEYGCLGQSVCVLERLDSK
jgi:SAM-dependent methyltransferase